MGNDDYGKGYPVVRAWPRDDAPRPRKERYVPHRPNADGRLIAVATRVKEELWPDGNNGGKS